MKKGANCTVSEENPLHDHRPMAVQIGPMVSGLVPCIADNSAPENYERAARFRVLQRVGPEHLDEELLDRLTLSVEDWADLWARPIGERKSFRQWVEERPYPRRRKDELYEALEWLEHHRHLPKRYRLVKTHMKREFYPAFKDPRLINARSDRFKVLFGPYCEWMQDQLFHLPMFIKHIPVRERPAYVEDMLAPMPYKFVSDYSRFESSMRPELIEAIEAVVYRRFGVPEWMITVLKSESRLRHRFLQANVTGTRMSGEMNTSLGNSLVNLLVFRFWAQETGNQIISVVEGDDGAHGATAMPDPGWFTALGFKVDIQTRANIGELGFLSTFWAGDHTILGDPFRLVRLGWSVHLGPQAGPKVRRNLFGATCLSLAYEMGDCPIFWAMALQYGAQGKLRNEYWTRYELETFGCPYELVGNGEWLQLTGHLHVRAPSPQARWDYFLMFGITPTDQLDIERQIRSGAQVIRNPGLTNALTATYPELQMSTRFLVMD